MLRAQEVRGHCRTLAHIGVPTPVLCRSRLLLAHEGLAAGDPPVETTRRDVADGDVRDARGMQADVPPERVARGACSRRREAASHSCDYCRLGREEIDLLVVLVHEPRQRLLDLYERHWRCFGPI